MQHTIELDCAPGFPRPGDLITGVVRGTSLENVLLPDNSVSRVMGNWTWKFELADEEYAQIQPIIKERIIILYEQQQIRYGSW